MNSLSIQRDIPFSSLTTLEVGGPARILSRCQDVDQVGALLAIAHDEALDIQVLGRGSNVIVAERGLDCFVLQITDDHLSADLTTGRVHVAAGYDWDRLVAWTVDQDLAGLECLSGIPGSVGAAPIQNVGAYGQEVAEVLEFVHVVDLENGEFQDLDAEACAFGYRDSRFKRDWRGRYCVVGLTLRLIPHGAPHVSYGELERRLEAAGGVWDLDQVRQQVLAIRRSKSMVLDPDDPNRRSAGSFFTNPIVSDDDFASILAAAQVEATEIPHWELGPGQIKVAAAWLIQRSGFDKGHVQGNAGLSSNHVLALINRGGASADELVALARVIRDRVVDTFGVRLRPEPIPLGFEPEETEDLWY